MTTFLSVSSYMLILLICQAYGEEVKENPLKCEQDEFKCGDVCIDESGACICSNVTLSKYSEDYCCVAPEDNCTRKYSNFANCTEGQPLPKRTPCYGACSENSNSNATDLEGHSTCGYSEHCPFDGYRGWYMCGNICTPKFVDCVCGNTTLHYHAHTQHYCCVAQGEVCTSQLDEWKLLTVCPTGKTVHKSEPCHGICPENRNPAKRNGSDILTCSYQDQCSYH